MPSPTFEYGRDAFAFVEALDRTQGADEVVDRMREALREFGFEFFCFSNFARADQKFEEVMWACRVPDEWLKVYLERDYAHDDPSIRMCKRTVHPFEYSEAPYDPEREPRAAEVMQRARDFRVAHGLLIPIPSPSGCVGNAWVGGYQPDLSLRSRPVVHLMALYAFDRLRGLAAPTLERKPRLTRRECEVLTWIANGKSAWEIGEILNISKRTVDEHAQTTFRKLDAANRTQAVAIALRDRIIDL
jgi:LuxR family quorum sensing-dependent transcriptional regulator